MRFRYLDGLRGLAALIVVLDHYAIGFFPAAVDVNAAAHYAGIEHWFQSTPLHILVGGNFSVCIFFVLSGFVLSAKFFRTRERGVVLASAAKRYLRLAVPVIASVMLAYLLISLHWFYNTQLAHQTGSLWLLRFWREQPSIWSALYHGSIGVFVGGASDAYNTVLWTMKVELIGSFLVFAVLLSLGKLRYRAVAYVLLCLLLVKTYYPAFILGIAICDYCHNGGGVIEKYLRRGWWLPLLVLSLYLGSSPVGDLRGTPFAHLTGLMPAGLSVATITHIIGGAGLVLAVVHATKLQQWLAAKPLQLLGVTSFALYLTHLLVMGSFSSFVFTKLSPAVGYGLGFVLMVIPSAMLIWFVARLFTRLVDQPAMRLSDGFYRLLFKARLGKLVVRWRKPEFAE